jgi:hypothetical protein
MRPVKEKEKSSRKDSLTGNVAVRDITSGMVSALRKNPVRSDYA